MLALFLWLVFFLVMAGLALYFFFKNRSKEEQLERDMKKPDSGNY